MRKFVPIQYVSLEQAATFDSRRDKSGGSETCWNWTGSKDARGYGKVKYGGISIRAHRLAYFIAHRQDPGDMMVCHRCDNTSCCNPAHLFLGQHTDNMADMVKKGRARGGSPAGAAAHNAKLSDADMEKVRAMIVAGSTNVAIGRVFGVTHQAISRVRRGRSWGSEPMQAKYASLRR